MADKETPIRFALFLVNGSDPEKFGVATEPDPNTKFRGEMGTVRFLSEDELRRLLAEAGNHPSEIEVMIEQARKNPR